MAEEAGREGSRGFARNGRVQAAPWLEWGYAGPCRRETSNSQQPSDCSSRVLEGRKGTPLQNTPGQAPYQAGPSNPSPPRPPPKKKFDCSQFLKNSPQESLCLTCSCVSDTLAQAEHRQSWSLGPGTALITRIANLLASLSLRLSQSTSSILLVKCFSLEQSSHRWTRGEVDTITAHSLPESTEGCTGPWVPPLAAPRPALVC